MTEEIILKVHVSHVEQHAIPMDPLAKQWSLLACCQLTPKFGKGHLGK